MLIHRASLDVAFAALHSSRTGLTPDDAAARRLEFGPNRIELAQTVPILLRFITQFTHFFAVLLWVAALLALIADRQMPGQGMATLGLAIIGVIVINGVFSFWQEYKTEETMAALQQLLPHQVKVQRSGAVTVVASEEIVPGDVIFLAAGDNVPADCRLLESFGVHVNNSTITGRRGRSRAPFRETPTMISS
jgi:sodium/potassium-transporting ATPase subunit alpha